MIISVPKALPSQIINSVQLDGSSYSLTIYYQLFGKRYYFLISDYSGATVVNMPLIDSIPNLLMGWFKTSTMTYSAQDEVVTILP